MRRLSANRSHRHPIKIVRLNSALTLCSKKFATNTAFPFPILQYLRNGCTHIRKASDRHGSPAVQESQCRSVRRWQETIEPLKGLCVRTVSSCRRLPRTTTLPCPAFTDGSRIPSILLSEAGRARCTEQRNFVPILNTEIPS